jgi:hypothetical protein
VNKLGHRRWARTGGKDRMQRQGAETGGKVGLRELHSPTELRTLGGHGEDDMLRRLIRV